MKKTVFTIALLICVVCFTNAQVKGKSIGIRGGMGGELSFQTAMGTANRLEIDLGNTSFNSATNYSGTQLTGIYQWAWALDELGPGFDWYAGFGGTLGSYSNNSKSEFMTFVYSPNPGDWRYWVKPVSWVHRSTRATSSCCFNVKWN